MSRNATASWSGYAHQGKIGLLIALTKVNFLSETGTDLQEYTINYETQEDITLSQGNNAIEVHQVKAYVNGTTISKYTDALLTFESCTGLNALHSVCEITNWDSLTAAQNPRSVARYIYSNGNNYCSLIDINNIIDIEIFNLLNKLGHAQADNEHWRQETFYYFLGILDDKIRIEHATKVQSDYQINFSLQEIHDIIVNRPQNRRKTLRSIKMKLYNAYLEILCDLENQSLVLTQSQESEINACIMKIYGLDDNDFEQFLIYINPHTTEGVNFEMCIATDDFFSKENFQAVFLDCVRQVNQSQLTLEKKKPPHYYKGKNYLLTSINSPSVHIEKCARQILRNNKLNFTAYETDYIINENHEGELGGIASVLGDFDPNKFFEKKDMKFIKKINAINALN